MKYFLFANLHLFDGEGGQAATATSDNATQDTGVKIPWNLLDAEADDGSNSVAQETTAQNAEQSDEQTEGQNATDEHEGKQSLSEILKNDAELNAQYKAEMSKAIKERVKSLHKSNGELNSTVDKQKSILNIVAQKYGIDANDIDALTNAVNSDDDYLMQAALDNGVSIEQQRQSFNQQQQLSVLQQQNEQLMQEQEKQKTLLDLRNQEQEVKGIYEDFNLDEALEDESFRFALAFTKGSYGTENVQKAYEMCNLDKLRNQAVQTTAKQVKQAMSNNIMAGQYIPAENGTTGKASAPVMRDVNAMSDDDINNLVRQRRENGVDISKLFR